MKGEEVQYQTCMASKLLFPCPVWYTYSDDVKIDTDHCKERRIRHEKNWFLIGGFKRSRPLLQIPLYLIELYFQAENRERGQRKRTRVCPTTRHFVSP